MVEEKKLDELDILFPGIDIKIAEGIVVTVTPILLEDLPKVLPYLVSLFQLFQAGQSPAEIASSATKELLAVLPFCINVPLKRLPAHAAPALVSALIDLNVTDELVSKIKTLSERVVKLAGDRQGLAK